MNRIGGSQPGAGFSWFILWHVERVRRTDYADGTDKLALKRERGRLAQNSCLGKRHPDGMPSERKIE
jgi:hypothetical protein